MIVNIVYLILYIEIGITSILKIIHGESHSVIYDSIYIMSKSRQNCSILLTWDSGSWEGGWEWGF